MSGIEDEAFERLLMEGIPQILADELADEVDMADLEGAEPIEVPAELREKIMVKAHRFGGLLAAAEAKAEGVKNIVGWEPETDVERAWLEQTLAARAEAVSTRRLATPADIRAIEPHGRRLSDETVARIVEDASTEHVAPGFRDMDEAAGSPVELPEKDTQDSSS